MPLPLVFRRVVGRDLADAFTYYEEQVEGLGEGFLSAVDSTAEAKANRAAGEIGSNNPVLAPIWAL